MPAMSVQLDAREEEALYAVLKPREDRLPEPLRAMLRRLEKTLFDRLTIEELEGLAARYPEGR
jgi:hypothetical protein